MIKIIHNRNKFFILSGILIIISVLSLSFWGLDLGIDFTGGALMEVQGKIYLSAQEIGSKISADVPEAGDVRVQPTEDGYLLRMRDLSEDKHQQVLVTLKNMAQDGGHESDTPTEDVVENDEQGDPSTPSTDVEVAQDDYQISEKRFESVGPVIGQELKSKAWWAILAALIIIIIFIAWTFRKVSKPVASWKYGIGAIIALAHDLIIVMGIFSVLGHFFLGYEVDILFVTALLTILGYSVNDTIVVYDRARENLIYNPQDTFENTINKSVNDTITRSINTSLTTLLVLLSLYFLGGSTIQSFVFALMMGTLVGAYSSIFIASALLVVWQKVSKK